MLFPKNVLGLETECEKQGGECKQILHNTCPNGYIGPISSSGCESSKERCCIPLKSGCHNQILLGECQEGSERCSSNELVCCSNPDDCPSALSVYNLCQQNEECFACLDQGKIWTALGCLPADPEKLIKMFFPYLLGIGGTIAFGFIVFGGIQVMTSSGDPEKIKGGKELITSALTGLVFIILSLFLLKLIGVDILGLPGLE